MKKNQLFSASEDGEVKLWDLRSENGNSSTVKPYENEVKNLFYNKNFHKISIQKLRFAQDPIMVDILTV